MSAGAIRRSWRPAARIVLWQFEHGAVGPSARQITTLSGLSLPRAVQAEAANRVIGLPWAASRLAASSTRGSLTLPHIRLASNSSALRSEDEDKDESLELANKNSDKGDLVRSNYWGITPKENLREDGTPWPWNCFRVTKFLSLSMHKHRCLQNAKLSCGAETLTSSSKLWSFS